VLYTALQTQTNQTLNIRTANLSLVKEINL